MPFVGPSGQLPDRALEAAGLDRQRLYLTHTVKHFKYGQRGKARLHKRASAAELLRVRPSIAVGLGAMAAQRLFGSDFRITREHGLWRRLDAPMRGIATWHPSAVLRMRGGASRRAAEAQRVADLRAVAEAVQTRA